MRQEKQKRIDALVAELTASYHQERDMALRFCHFAEPQCDHWHRKEAAPTAVSRLF